MFCTRVPRREQVNTTPLAPAAWLLLRECVRQTKALLGDGVTTVVPRRFGFHGRAFTLSRFPRSGGDDCV